MRKALPRALKRRIKEFLRSTFELQIPWLNSISEPWDKSKALLSVIIPCHNYGRFIEDALRSLRSQTWQNFEIIIIDDGSTENETLQVLRRLRDDGVSVLRQEDVGPAQARNVGVSQANGKHICCLDADDTVEPTYFEKCVSLLESNPGVSFAYSLVRLFEDQQEIWQTQPFNLRLLLEYNHVCVGAVFSKQSWEKSGGFDPAMRGYEDWDFWIRMGKAGFRGQLIPEPLYNHRRHRGSFGQRAEQKRAALMSRIRENHSDLLSDPKRIDTIEKGYRNRRVPDAFLNMRSPRDYRSDELTCLVLTSWKHAGGAEAILRALLHGLKARGWNFVLVSTDDDPGDVDERLLVISEETYCLANFLDQGYWLSFATNLAYTRRAQLILISNSKLAYEWTPKLRADGSIPIIEILHNDSSLGCIGLSTQFEPYIDYHIAISERIRRSLIDRYGVSDAKVGAVYNGVDTDHFNRSGFSRTICLRELGLEEASFVVSYIGRLSQEKGTRYLPVIAERLVKRGAFFLIVGDGPERKFLQRAIGRRGIESSVRMLGHRNDIRNILAASSVVVLPSQVEGFPVTLLESMAMEVPVVASDVGEVRSIVEDGRNGFIVKPGDIASFESRLSELLTNAEKAKDFGRHGRELVIAKYSLKRTVAKYDEILKRLLARTAIAAR